MKPALAALLLFIQPLCLSAKGDTVRITIQGDSLAHPIEISDAATVGQFNVWTGPGTSNASNDGFIADWSHPIAGLPKGVHLFEVAFQTSRRDSRPYTVLYAIDPATHRGYVYVPGKSDPHYRDNIALIYRANEGRWFPALSVWEQIANPLLAAGLSTQQ